MCMEPIAIDWAAGRGIAEILSSCYVFPLFDLQTLDSQRPHACEAGVSMLTVTEALKRRISTREFRPLPLAEPLVREILDVARWAPSGGNLQPW
jgi:hypothetical protein